MLKKLFLIAIAVVSYVSVTYADGIVFYDMTLPEAQAKAAEEGKLVFVDCYTPWCGPCKAMAKNIFPLDSCGQFMNPRFVSVMKDLEAEDNVYIAQKYGVKIYPTFLILNPDGSLYHRIEGGAVKTAGKFIDRVARALRLGEFESRYAAGERGGEFMVDYVSMIDPRSGKEIAAVLDGYIPTLTPGALALEPSQALIGKIPSTDCPSFRHVFDNRAGLAQELGQERASELVAGVLRREFMAKRMNPSFDFTSRLADLSQLKSEGYELPRFLYESMVMRDVLNKKDSSRMDQIVSMIEVIGSAIAPESAKLDALNSLRGYRKALGLGEDNPVATALRNVAPSMSDSSRRALENMR